MSPGAFRSLADGDRVEMMAHRREYQLRKSHAEHVGEQVAKIFADRDSKK